ncbi:mitochondrial 39-S ribosomal protein L47 (MRP-L47)-domain-containing protein [Lineolata rhizophorae]|uniref:Large ribosomal subunit protein uL29m n=1 Tax=Lineolata rhizophorae TaxID=578093 RepID=A0A6A6NTP1_9PEZI|nr:mitochondrial 39-S ribosomal protein L47 (MRP-L47)-domain-containing protein [Lineolata rhizophorae]
MSLPAARRLARRPQRLPSAFPCAAAAVPADCLPLRLLCTTGGASASAASARTTSSRSPGSPSLSSAPASAPASPLTSARRAFSTAAARLTRHRGPRGDRNANRGVSALRRTGLRPRQTLSVGKDGLPTPVFDAGKRARPEGDEDHGLWGFFGERRKCILTPEEMNAFGREWTVEELRRKSWEDLHGLWWVCARERNRIKTDSAERQRLQAGYGQFEADERYKTALRTQKNIRNALIERWYAWGSARQAARDDPEIVMYARKGEPAYKPSTSYEPEEAEDVEVKAEEVAPSQERKPQDQQPRA